MAERQEVTCRNIKPGNMIFQEFSNDVLQANIDESIIDKKIQEIRKKVSQLEGNDRKTWLLKAISFIDLTSLGADDVPTKIQALCRKAVNPIGKSSTMSASLHTAAVCVFPLRLIDAVTALRTLDPKHNVSISGVAGGFPSGQYPLETRLREIEYSIENGANEIDIVINRPLALMQQWNELYEELKSFRQVCGHKAILKTILATGELVNLDNVYKASMVAMMAGADFIKTSTGKETVNATLPVGIVMCQAIKDYYNWTERKVGFKPAGGIKTAQEALEWMTLIQTELGDEWLTKDLFRIGASSLLDNIVAALN